MIYLVPVDICDIFGAGETGQLFDRSNAYDLRRISSCYNKRNQRYHTSSKSSLTQIGRGVPQYRLRDMFQSRAFASQFPNLLSPTDCGTLCTRGSMTEASISRTLDEPSRFLIVFHKLIYNRLYSNEPGGYGTVDQGCTRSAPGLNID